MKKDIILLVGKSATGKTEVEKELGRKGWHRAISYTSRPKRYNEEEGNEYFFTDNETIDKLHKDGLLYELTEYNVEDDKPWKYALGVKSFVDNNINVATVNVHGANQLLAHDELRDRILVVVLNSGNMARYFRYVDREIPKKDRLLFTYEYMDEVNERFKKRDVQDSIDFKGLLMITPKDTKLFLNGDPDVLTIFNGHRTKIKEIVKEIRGKVKDYNTERGRHK